MAITRRPGSSRVEAFKAAGDAAMFPEQIAAGLRPWQPLKLYMGGVRENEDWTLRVDTGVYDPVLGESYQTFSRLGLSFQRSQNGGLFSAQPGPSVSYYKRLQSIVDTPAKESSFFDGIDTTIPGIYKALRKTAPAGAEAALQAIDREIKSAIQSFKMVEPSASTPALARALAATHAAQRQLGGDPDVASLLALKEQQLQAALRATLGVSFTALAQPAGTEEPTGPFAAFARPPAMPPVVPGQAFEVKTTFTNRSPIELKALRVKLEGNGTWAAQPETSGTGRRQQRPGVVHIHAHDSGGRRPDTALFLAEVDSGSPVHDVGGVAILPAQRRAAARSGRDFRRQRRAHGDPRAGHTSGCEPSVRLRDARARHRASDRSHHAPEPGWWCRSEREKRTFVCGSRCRATRKAGMKARSGSIAPSGWNVEPASQPFQFARAGERMFYPFTVTIPTLENREYRLEAVASSGGREYREGYEAIQHRDLQPQFLYRDASASVRGVDVTIAPGLKVGYVMGIGDDVPAGLTQLGVDVQLLAGQDLATADLSRFDAIMTGTRAYAVRDDLKTYNRRLLDYVKGGGNLIVLYNTQELVPNQFAPFPGELSRDAEEVSEEDSPVEILAPSDPVFNTPNKISKADFDNWVEQRGSKFWSTWDAAYSPMIATWDQGQKPQRGGWLHAKYGAGHYTYFAYAFHRQLPYGVPGAYRLLANLLSLNRPAPASQRGR